MHNHSSYPSTFTDSHNCQVEASSTPIQKYTDVEEALSASPLHRLTEDWLHFFPKVKGESCSDKREWVCYTWKWSAAIQSKVIYHSVNLYWPLSFSIYKNSSGLILFLYRRNPLDLLSWTTSFVFSWTEYWHIKLNTILTTWTEYLVKGSKKFNTFLKRQYQKVH